MNKNMNNIRKIKHKKGWPASEVENTITRPSLLLTFNLNSLCKRMTVAHMGTDISRYD